MNPSGHSSNRTPQKPQNVVTSRATTARRATLKSHHAATRGRPIGSTASKSRTAGRSAINRWSSSR